MHRSGTTLLARLMDASGIFMGVDKDHNFESIPFLSQNQKAMEKAGGDWLDPVVPGDDIEPEFSAREMYAEHLKLSTSYERLRYQLFPMAWGWKDPRNSFCLDMWLRQYPKAKVIHISRAEEDVVRSLMRRNHIPGEVHDPRLDDPKFAYELTRRYLDQSRSYATQLGKKYLEITYENLVRKDPRCLIALREFTGRPVADHIDKILRT